MNFQLPKIPFLAICLTIFYFSGVQVTSAQSNLDYCNAVQNRVGLIRYPIGTIAATSVGAGEIADAMTLVPRIYPCVNEVVDRGSNNDWRASISGDPSLLKIKYQAGKPSGASSSEITVTPHLSVFKITFPEKTEKKYVVLDFSKYKMDNWATLYKWNERSVTWIDDKTIQATISEPGKKGVFYTLKFSQPCISSGIIDSTGIVKAGVERASGLKLAMYAQFDAASVTVSVSESFTSMDQTLEFLLKEPADFSSAYQQCKKAWENTINAVQMEGSENSKRMAYTALYSMLVNVISGSQGCAYLPYYPRPVSIASSAYWQFIGGFQSCAWDNYRTVYPFLMLGYPEMMKDVVNTYLARYKRDRCVDGNICLFTGPTGGHRNIRFNSVIAEEALQSGVKADISGLFLALKSNFSDDRFFPPTISTLGYATQPATGGKACSETLEWSTGLHALAMLAKANGDKEEMNRDYKLSNSYKNVWDKDSLLFRVKNVDGSWGIINNKSMTWDPNPQGLFEGTNKDWMFSVPHDPYGLINLPGQSRFVERVVDYCMNYTWFNDYQYHYPCFLYYADAANKAQKILRQAWVPMFNAGVIYEGVKPNPTRGGWNTHYTSNAGWLICCMSGLYPLASPAGQYLITSPSLTKTVIHNGKKSITVRAANNSDENIYIKQIKVDGKIYPCYMIPAGKLVSGVTIDLTMSYDPECRLGNLYISSTDGFVRNAELVSETRLKCKIEAAITNSTTKIYCASKPVKLTVNGKKLEILDFDQSSKILTIQSKEVALIDVFLK
jgi:putative alpha-1,2-mannosidase